MIAVRLEMEEWQRVLAILAQAPWSAANPLIMAIGEQLRVAAQAAPSPGEDRPGTPAAPNASIVNPPVNIDWSKVQKTQHPK